MIFKRIILTTILLTFISPSLVNAQFSNSTELHTKMTNTLIQPPYLKAGDTVAIVAPSGVLNGRDKEVNQAKELVADLRATDEDEYDKNITNLIVKAFNIKLKR